MCGTIGVLLRSAAAAPQLTRSLTRLEYRGYDSAGLATLEKGAIRRVRAEGKLQNLRRKLRGNQLLGRTGIGHTRWATHGKPNENNAHPHGNKNLTIVHNGVIDNFEVLRAELKKRGAKFTTQTDTEVVVHAVEEKLKSGLSPHKAVAAVLRRLQGRYALIFMFAGEDDLLIGARKGSPLAVGYGNGEMYLGSDAIALAPFTDTLAYLEDGDVAVVCRAGAEIYDAKGTRVERAKVIVDVEKLLHGKGRYQYFMEKEIWEQPDVLRNTINFYIDRVNARVRLPKCGVDFRKIKHIYLIACGTSYYACATVQYALEELTGLPVTIEIASEFRYKKKTLPKNTLAVFVSQSGETADTDQCLEYVKARRMPTFAVVNVPTSSIARKSTCVLPTLAGPEIGVASTKAFTCQLAVLTCLAVAIGRKRGIVSRASEREMVKELLAVPRHVHTTLETCNGKIAKLARDLVKKQSVLYLGRGPLYPLAMEGALKLKELSYIHAEGYAAGELKHGPIALIDPEMISIVLAPSRGHVPWFEKTMSNVHEITARGGRIILITDKDGSRVGGIRSSHSIVLPSVSRFVAPMVHAVPVQLLAYHTARLKRLDIDQPRNLAKSVTVE